MTFLNPLDGLIAKTPVSFFCRLWVRVTSGAQGSVSVGFWGTRQLSFWGGGAGSSQRAASTPPPQLKARPPLRGAGRADVSCLPLVQGPWTAPYPPGHKPRSPAPAPVPSPAPAPHAWEQEVYALKAEADRRLEAAQVLEQSLAQREAALSTTLRTQLSELAGSAARSGAFEAQVKVDARACDEGGCRVQLCGR